ERGARPRPFPAVPRNLMSSFSPPRGSCGGSGCVFVERLFILEHFAQGGRRPQRLLEPPRFALGAGAPPIPFGYEAQNPPDFINSLGDGEIPAFDLLRPRLIS